MKYEIDSAHTRIEFDGKHMVFTTVRGAFTEFEGSLEADGDDYSTLRGEIVLQAASVNTGDPKRDDHLRSADFFDVEKFATIKFVPTSVVAKDATNHVVTGDLTIKDVTRPIELKVEILGVINDPWGNARTAQPAVHHQPQGLGAGVEHGARRRQRAGQRQDQHQRRGRGPAQAGSRRRGRRLTAAFSGRK